MAKERMWLIESWMMTHRFAMSVHAPLWGHVEGRGGGEGREVKVRALARQ